MTPLPFMETSKNARQKIIQDFKRSAKNILVATDVASRGLDIKDIKSVINYDFPQTIEDYIHRIGRTGRAGAKGESFTFFTDDDCGHAQDLMDVLKKCKKEIPPELFRLADKARTKRKRKFGYEGCMKSYWHSARSGFGPDGNTGDRFGGRQRSRSPPNRVYDTGPSNAWGGSRPTAGYTNGNSWATNTGSTGTSGYGAGSWQTQSNTTPSYSQAGYGQSWGNQGGNSWQTQQAQATNYYGSGSNSQNTSYQAAPTDYRAQPTAYPGTAGPVQNPSQALKPVEHNGYSRYEDLVKQTAPVQGPSQGPAQYPLTNTAQKPSLKPVDSNSQNPMTGNSNPMSAQKFTSNSQNSQVSTGYPTGNKAGVAGTGPSNPMSTANKPVAGPQAAPVNANAGYKGATFSNSYDTMASNLMSYTKENPEMIGSGANTDPAGPPKLGDLGM